MAWWGKLIGGTLGFLAGGPIGALLGASFGHSFDDSTPKSDSWRALPGNQERVQAAFFTATFSVMGYVAKADGKVTQDEINLANALMGEMQLSSEQRELARSLFNQGKEPGFEFDAIIEQFRVECHRRTNLLRMFLEIQVQAALADSRLDPKENEILQYLADHLGFSHEILQQIIQMVQGSSHHHEQPGKFGIDESYDILGVKPDTPMAEVKRAYRRLMSQHHPDKLVSKGLPEEMIQLANDKTHQIQTAWKTIRESREQFSG